MIINPLQVRDRLSPEIKAFMHKILEPLPEKRIPLDSMYEEPWFRLGSQPSVLSSQMNMHDGARTSLFLAGPSHHVYTTYDGVTIMDADTQQIAYSRQVFPMPIIGGQPQPSVHQNITNRYTNGRSHAEIPLTRTSSKAHNFKDSEK